MEQNTKMVDITEDVTEKSLFDQDPTQGILVRKQIGKQLFLVRVHLPESGKERLQEKICRMVKDEVLADKYMQP